MEVKRKSFKTPKLLAYVIRWRIMPPLPSMSPLRSQNSEIPRRVCIPTPISSLSPSFDWTDQSLPSFSFPPILVNSWFLTPSNSFPVHSQALLACSLFQLYPFTTPELLITLGRINTIHLLSVLLCWCCQAWLEKSGKHFALVHCNFTLTSLLYSTNRLSLNACCLNSYNTIYHSNSPVSKSHWYEILLFHNAT